MFLQGDYQESVNQNLTGSVRQSDYLPVKGETVDIVVEEITTNNGIKGLFVTGPCIPKKAEQAASLDFASFLGEAEGVDILREEEEEVETAPFATTNS